MRDWGPSAQDVRHRIFFNFNAPLARGVRMGLNVQGASALPYNITPVSTPTATRCSTIAPPASAATARRGAAQWTANMRLNKSIRPRRRALGSAEHAAASAAPAVGRRHGAARGRRRPRRRRRSADGGDGRRQHQIPAGPVPERAERCSTTSNYNAFIGNQLSSFFGTATSAGPARASKSAPPSDSRRILPRDEGIESHAGVDPGIFFCNIL